MLDLMVKDFTYEDGKIEEKEVLYEDSINNQIKAMKFLLSILNQSFAKKLQEYKESKAESLEEEIKEMTLDLLSSIINKELHQKKKAVVKNSFNEMFKYVGIPVDSDKFHEIKAEFLSHFSKVLEYLQGLVSREKSINLHINEYLSGIIKFGCIDLLKKIIESGQVKVNHILNDENDSLLHYASAYNRSELVKYLLEQGADVNHKNKSGETPLNFLINIVEPVSFRIFNEKKEEINLKYLLIDKGDVLNFQSDDIGAARSFEVLEEKDIAISSYFQTIEILREKGADINSQDKSGSTALHSAATYHINYEMVLYLVDHGANPNLQDNNGSTAMMSMMQVDMLDLRMVYLLLNAGSDAEIRDKDGNDFFLLVHDNKKLAKNYRKDIFKYIDHQMQKKAYLEQSHPRPENEEEEPRKKIAKIKVSSDVHNNGEIFPDENSDPNIAQKKAQNLNLENMNSYDLYDIKGRTESSDEIFMIGSNESQELPNPFFTDEVLID